jgi:hypothetical protein
MLRTLAKGRVLRSSYTSTQLSRVCLSDLLAITYFLVANNFWQTVAMAPATVRKNSSLPAGRESIL